LEQVTDPDVVIVHDPPACTGCGADLTDAEVTGTTVRQVFDIPPIKVHVTEHRTVTRRCACGQTTCGDTPAGVKAPVQYGPVMCAVIVYLYMGQFLSKKRTAQAISELFDIPLSHGTVGAVTARAATGLDECLAQVTEHIKAAPVVNFDETGLRADGRLTWLHSASTSRYSLLFAHTRRGKVAMNDMGILPDYAGIAVHDAWAPYDTYTGAAHALCNAHLLRELQAVIDHHQAENNTDAWCWADQVGFALLTLHRAAAASPGHPVDPSIVAAQRRLIRHGILTADHPDGKLGNKHRALARRLDRRLDDYLQFAVNPAVPFTNNAAEQEIRMAKIRQKISGTMRTLTGAEHFAALRSYIQTTNKHDIPALAALTALTSGNPWLPNPT
jgi:transposase